MNTTSSPAIRTPAGTRPSSRVCLSTCITCERHRAAFRLRKGAYAGILMGIVFLGALLAPNIAFGIPASPWPVELTQPDGTQITLHIRGDEFFHWYEDLEGYTVVLDEDAYVYASLDLDGRLSPTKHLVGTVDPATVGLAPKIHPSADVINQLRSESFATPSQRGGTIERVPPSGTIKNLVVLCKFSDHAFGTHTRPESDYDVLFNAVGGDASLAPTGSVRDCYAENSYGTMTLVSTVVAWVTLPHTEAYYADGSSGSGSYPTNPQGMVEDALNLVDSLVDFGEFDTDNDGYIDAIDFVHSGYGAETGGGGGNWIWSHRWSLWALPGGQWTSGDLNGAGQPVKVYDYHTEPALWGTFGTQILRIGVVSHESGHFFGLPDLYDIDGSSEGIGSYGMMANSWGFDFSQYHPPHFCAWSKIFLGWVTPTVLTTPGVYTAAQVEFAPTVYRIDHGYPSGEYLLIENRQPVGLESAMPQGGLAIWHIDEAKAGTVNTEEGYPLSAGWPGNNRHYMVALLQADGAYDLERNQNRGDGGDVYHAGGVWKISGHTVPSLDTYQDGIVVSSENIVSEISASSSTMTFKWGFDCNDNGIDDGIDTDFGGGSLDCNGNSVPDECEPDCNGNGVADECDITSGAYEDCNGNLVPDPCETTGGGILLDEDFEGGLQPSWQASGIFKITTLCGASTPSSGTHWAYAGSTATCTYGDDKFGRLSAPAVTLAYGLNELQFCSRLNSEQGWDFASILVDGEPVWSESGGYGGWEDRVVDLSAFGGQTVSITFEFESDTYISGTLGWQVDNIRLLSGDLDCNTNGVMDECEVLDGTSFDCNGNHILDECEDLPQTDCNENGVQDICDVAFGTSLDCNGNDVPDECDLSSGNSEDCNSNGLPDDCEITRSLIQEPNQVDGAFTDGDCDFCGWTPPEQSVAENFVLSSVQTLTGAVIWGGYAPDNFIPIGDSFTVILHQDNGGLPGQVIYSEDSVQVVRTATGRELFDFGIDEYRYVLQFNQPITLPAGSYYIEVFNFSGLSLETFFWETGSFDTERGAPGVAISNTTPGVAWAFDDSFEVAIRLVGSVQDVDCNADGILDTCGQPPLVLDLGPDRHLAPNRTYTPLAPAMSTLPSDASLVYEWSIVSGPATSGISDTSSSAPSFTPPVQGTYVIRCDITDSSPGPCTASDEIAIHVAPMVLNLPSQRLGCVGSETLPLADATTVTGGTTPYLYQWTVINGPTDFDELQAQSAAPSLTPMTTDDYDIHVTVTDSSAPPNVVSGSTHLTVREGPSVSAGLAATYHPIIMIGDQLDIGDEPTASGGYAPYSYGWSIPVNPNLAGKIKNPTSSNPTFSATQKGAYVVRVQVTDAAGCSDETQFTISVVTDPPSSTAPIVPGLNPGQCGTCGATGGAALGTLLICTIVMYSRRRPGRR